MNMQVIRQHLDDVEIVDIEIAEGWVARDIKTTEECDDAFAYLTAAIASIEYQIEAEGFKPLSQQRGDWVARAKSALRFKKGALAIVNHRRGAINEAIRIARQDEEDKRFLVFIKGALPPAQWVEIVAAFRSGSTERY